MTASTLEFLAMPNGLVALTLPASPAAESLPPPAQAARVLPSGMSAAAAIEPRRKVRRSSGVFSIVIVRLIFLGCCRVAGGWWSGMTSKPIAVPGLELVVVLIPAGDVGGQV